MCQFRMEDIVEVERLTLEEVARIGETPVLQKDHRDGANVHWGDLHPRTVGQTGAAHVVKRAMVENVDVARFILQECVHSTVEQVDEPLTPNTASGAVRKFPTRLPC